MMLRALPYLIGNLLSYRVCNFNSSWLIDQYRFLFISIIKINGYESIKWVVEITDQKINY